VDYRAGMDANSEGRAMPMRRVGRDSVPGTYRFHERIQLDGNGESDRGSRHIVGGGSPDRTLPTWYYGGILTAIGFVLLIVTLIYSGRYH
jgi:hypothetical protein